MQRNQIRVGPGRHRDIIFNLPLVAIINQVDAGVNFVHAHFGKFHNENCILGGHADQHYQSDLCKNIVYITFGKQSCNE